MSTLTGYSFRTPFLLVVATFLCPLSVHSQADSFIRVVSSRPDAVSGNEALVDIRMPGDFHRDFSVRLGGRDVTSAFRQLSGSTWRRGLVRRLATGENSLELRVHGAVIAKATLIDHPISGPIFSGPHQEPYACETQANGLGPAVNANCESKTIVQYYYKSTEGEDSLYSQGHVSRAHLTPGFKPYDPNMSMPADVEKTRTTEGKVVNYIVRREIGTINRAVYEIQFLHQPGDPLPDAWARHDSAWNGRLVYFFEGGCGAGYHQGTLGAVGSAQEPMISKGTPSRLQR